RDGRPCSPMTPRPARRPSPIGGRSTSASRARHAGRPWADGMGAFLRRDHAEKERGMSNDAVSMGERTYAETVARGFYGKNVGGLSGKYDNVRAHWEDAMTRVALRPFVRETVAQCTRARRGVRILDLGCGAGQGYE